MFNYNWKIQSGYPAKGIEKHNNNVFTTFACGGGSSMGYKLAGYNVIAANDIDPQMAKVYKKNHNPKYFFKCGIEELLNKDLPKELYNIDILDGSPPCSTFSMAGSREKKWGKEYQFREGQTKQILDDLFFQFIKLANKIKPKIIVAENVKGLLQGNAKGYVVEIINQLEKIGYKTQIFLLNSATMGVPQKRERVFFISTRKDLKLPKLNLQFNEKSITFNKIDEKEKMEKDLLPSQKKYWNKTQPGKSLSTVHPKGSFFNYIKIAPNKVVNTIISGGSYLHWKYQRRLNKNEIIKISSFPSDYDFLDIEPQYLMGMSVPPIMMAQISYQIYLQLLKKTL